MSAEHWTMRGLTDDTLSKRADDCLRHIRRADTILDGITTGETFEDIPNEIALAQAHATLALAMGAML